MMIKCPRCGFTQPNDKYCAQCGLDIENYRAPEIPIFQKIFGDPFLQLTAVVVIALGSGWYIFKHNKMEIQDRVSFFKQGIQYSRSLNPSTANPSAATEGGSLDTEVPQELMSGNDSLPTTTSSDAAAPPNTTIAADGPAAKTTETKSIGSENRQNTVAQIQYVEVSKDVLDQIFADSRQSGLFNSLGDHVAGLWPQGKKKIINLRGWRLLSRESKPIEWGKPMQFFVGLKGNDPENDLGLTTYMELTNIDGQGLHGHMEIVRSWREATPEGPPGIQRRFYPAPLDLPSDSIFFFAGVLPRDSNMESDPYLTNIEPFKILKSNLFKTKEAEFLVVVDFEKSNP